jgi:hypothetical protein
MLLVAAARKDGEMLTARRQVKKSERIAAGHSGEPDAGENSFPAFSGHQYYINLVDHGHQPQSID